VYRDAVEQGDGTLEMVRVMERGVHDSVRSIPSTPPVRSRLPRCGGSASI